MGEFMIQYSCLILGYPCGPRTFFDKFRQGNFNFCDKILLRGKSMKKIEVLKKEIEYYSKLYSPNCKKVIELKEKLAKLS